MKNLNQLLIAGLLCLLHSTIFSQESNLEIENSTKTYETVRIQTAKPVIDGVLNDECWFTGHWGGDFIQWIPNEGGVPTGQTKMKILYDDKNLYMAIRMYDPEPDKILIKASRRDQFGGDAVGVAFDSYHDHRTGFEFDVTSAGQRIDMIMTNPMVCDFNWNAVWNCKTGMEDSAWVAEFEIPFSQLRYANDEDQTWGLHVWRWIGRLGEESDWEPLSKTGPGMLYQFGHLTGLKGIAKSRRLEIMPYALTKVRTFRKQPGNPFADSGVNWNGSLGLDAKIGISSSFTADVTINPDFGQVEADPSNMNLTAFETFFEEKRPFFLEGGNIFKYNFDGVKLFYSRRIGQSPHFNPQVEDGEFVDLPDQTSILGAVKLSGKNAKGLSIGLMQCLSNCEVADFWSEGETSQITVEPLTNYTVARVQQDFNDGTTVLGGILTSTNRFSNEDKFNFMPTNSVTTGFDLFHQWKDKKYYLDARIIGSSLKGEREAVDLLQRSSARYFQRTDADHLNYDPNKTTLSGHGGQIRIGKGSKGLWRYSTGMCWRSPGLELNDVGFMHFADVVNVENLISYFVNKPVSVFRTYSVNFSQKSNWDYGMNFLSSEVSLSTKFEFLNKWGISPSFIYTGESLDNHLLRGGNAMKLPSVTASHISIHSDYAKKISFSMNAQFKSAEGKVLCSRSYNPAFSYQPITTLKFSFGMNYSQNRNELQYITTSYLESDKRYVLGKIDQKTLGVTFRLDYNITPELSIQYYGSPFASVGRYSKFKSITNPLASNYDDRFEQLNTVDQGETYLVTEDEHVDYSFDKPDFNFSQFRSNMVFRWEYKTGSQLYFVWSNERTNFEKSSNGSLGNAFRNFEKVFPKNLFLIKLNYWFNV